MEHCKYDYPETYIVLKKVTKRILLIYFKFTPLEYKQRGNFGTKCIQLTKEEIMEE